jgi:hypothetical protein
MCDRMWPIRRLEEYLPPAKFAQDGPDPRGQTSNAPVSSGCVVSGAAAVGSYRVLLDGFAARFDRADDEAWFEFSNGEAVLITAEMPGAPVHQYSRDPGRRSLTARGRHAPFA